MKRSTPKEEPPASTHICSRKVSVRVALPIFVTSFALAVSACDNGSSTPATSASAAVLTDTVAGIVPAAVNAVPQSAFNNFVVGQAGGAVTVTLTSAVETLPGGALNSTVAMGMGVGVPTATTCVLATGTAPTIFQAGATATLSGTAGAGVLCVLVTDVTIQPGPVAYTVVITHP